MFTFCSITDKLSTEMERRSQVYKDVSTQFSFLNNLRLSEEEYSRCCNNLVSFYQEDLSIDIVGEVQQFQNYIHFKYEGKNTDFTHAELYDIIVQDQIRSVFPNLDTAFRIVLTFMLTNVSAERSFSQLKRIKNPHRTTMGQERLDSLSLLCIEADVLRSVDFDDVIKDFAFAKSRTV